MILVLDDILALADIIFQSAKEDEDLNLSDFFDQLASPDKRSISSIAREFGRVRMGAINDYEYLKAVHKSLEYILQMPNLSEH